MSARFEAIAKCEFPPGGSAEGRPSYELFLERPLRAFQAAFQHWDSNAMPVKGISSIRSADVANDPYFPLLQAIAVEVTDDAMNVHVELDDLIVDWDFWTRPDDPDWD
jgi:hypothetical protein